MELNRNKVIFFVTLGTLLIFMFIFLIFLNLSNDGSNKKKEELDSLVIWTVFSDIGDVSKLISAFKEKYPKYKSKNINFNNFSDYEEYTYALSSAISRGKTPDVFVLNNNEQSVFRNKTSKIPSSVISINSFRKRYKSVFTKDLIKQTEEGEDYLLGIPVGYETLGIFYNKRFVKSTDLQSISTLNKVIFDIKGNSTAAIPIPIGIGNGKHVKFSEDIATQFMLFDSKGGDSLANLAPSQIKKQIGAYLNYGFKQSKNNFNNVTRDPLYLFINSDLYMLVGYPRFINDIKREGGISSNFLFVESFPHPAGDGGKTLVNYDYFVINKDSQHKNIGLDFLSFLASDEGSSKFLETYTFYLPALLSLEEGLNSKKIHKSYNVVIGNFYNPDYELVSFNKGMKVFYDKELRNILDLGSDFYFSFYNFKNKLTCQTKKILTLENLSSNCDN